MADFLRNEKGQEFNYPKAIQEKFEEVVFGEKIEDPYRWMEDLNHPTVIKWIDEENKLTRAILDSLPYRDYLQKEFRRMQDEIKYSLCSVAGDKYFFYKSGGNLNQPILLYSQGEFDPEGSKVVLDPNKWSEKGIEAVDWFETSPSGNLIAYGRSSGGSESSTLYVQEVDTGKVLDVIPKTKWASVAWVKAESGFFYTRNEGERFAPIVYFHKLGESWKKDKYIYGKDIEGIVSVSASRDGEHVFIAVDKSWSENDLYLLEDGLKPIAVGYSAQFIPIVYGDYLYILTNLDAPKYRLLKVKLSEADIKKAQEIIPESDWVLEKVDFAAGRMILKVKDNTYTRLLIYDLQGTFMYEIELPEKGTSSFWTIESSKSEIIYSFSSFFYPVSYHKFDLESKKEKTLYTSNIFINPKDYNLEFLFYPSKDGTKIPMYILYKTGLVIDGNTPTLLSGYGGFNLGLSPSYMGEIIPFLDKGGIYAEAGIRGGNEFGEEWHKQGMKENKKNVFEDFIRAAEFLIDEGYTNPDKLSIHGISNGGLLVGSVLTQRPDLFKAVVCDVGLLDMLRYHKFGIAHIWIPEYGNPDKHEDFNYLKEYSPYHNVNSNKTYPSILFRTSENDKRVSPIHTLKMCAKMQQIRKSKGPILFYMIKDTGHGAGMPMWKFIEWNVDMYSYIMWQLGM